MAGRNYKHIYILAELQAGWANIIRQRPAFAKGDLVAYSDKEKPGRLHQDTLYKGKGGELFFWPVFATPL